jgi:tetratricopeptide (TPR) repeat protein
LGFSDQALEKAGQALALSQKTDHPEDSVFALAATARLHRALRNSKKALELIEAARAAAHQHGWVQLMVDGASVYGWALAKEGRINEGISQLHQAQVVQQEIGSSHMRADLLAALAEVLKDAGRIEEGLAAVEEALEAVETTGTHHLEAEILLLKGDLLARKSENEYLESENPSPIVCENLSIQAEACFRHAIEIAGQQKAKAIELRASMSLARLLQKQNRCTDALQQLKELYDWFSEGYDTLDLRDARALLRQLS